MAAGFKLDVDASRVNSARQMAWGDQGGSFVGTFGLGTATAITEDGGEKEVKPILNSGVLSQRQAQGAGDAADGCQLLGRCSPWLARVLFQPKPSVPGTATAMEPAIYGAGVRLALQNRRTSCYKDHLGAPAVPRVAHQREAIF